MDRQIDPQVFEDAHSLDGVFPQPARAIRARHEALGMRDLAAHLVVRTDEIAEAHA